MKSRGNGRVTSHRTLQVLPFIVKILPFIMSKVETFAGFEHRNNLMCPTN